MGSPASSLRPFIRVVRPHIAQQLHARTASRRSYAQLSSAAALKGGSDLSIDASNRIRLRNGAIEVIDPLDAKAGVIPGKWLRDNCSCSSCRNESTGQRQINIFKNKKLGVVTQLKSLDDLHFEATFQDGHTTSISVPSLLKRRTQELERLRLGAVTATTWTSGISDSPPSVSHADIEAGNGLGKLLMSIRRFGFVFVEDMPPTPEATQALLELIGPIRNTHYGGFYDFTADLASKDTAYTAEALEPHTDTTYFSEPIGLQALHLLSHTDGNGGLSSLVDGFAAANQLREFNPRFYEILSKVNVYAHASGNEGISIQPFAPQPVFSHNSLGELTHVRWNNADRAGVAAGFNEVEEWYEAAGKFDELISDEKNQYCFQLTPGKCLIFDNWRALHGRSEFTGKRRICGGYINRDDYISKLRMTNLTPEDIHASTVTG